MLLSLLTKIVVYEYKYGKNNVGVKNNSQLMIYALGIYNVYKDFLLEIEEQRSLAAVQEKEKCVVLYPEH